MKLKTLYSRRGDGGTQEWTIEVENNKYRTICGTLNGKQVVSKWTECQGKNIGRANETTPNEQALSEAKSKWKKQYDKGYTEKKDKVDERGIFKPMLAQKYEGDIAYPVYTQPKLDGCRCIAKRDGLWSRGGKLITGTPHIIRELTPFFVKHPDAILDGELYADKLSDNFNAIISIVRKQSPDTSEEQKLIEEKIQYHIYDFPSCPGTFSVRSKSLELEIGNLASPYLLFVKTKIVNSQVELDELYAQFLEAGYEGQIIRLDGEYEHKRSFNLLKRKNFITEEYVIKDIIEGEGNRAGTAGTILLTVPGAPNDECEAGIKGDMSFYKKLLEDKTSYIGKLATIKYFNKTPNGSLRFPVMLCVRDYE